MYNEDEGIGRTNGGDTSHGKEVFAEMTKTLSLLDIIQRIKLAKFIFYLGTNMNKNASFVDETS